MADVNKIGQTALQDAPSSISRLLNSIKPVFSTYSGATKGIGAQPNNESPIAGVPQGSSNQILVTDPAKFAQSPRQVAVHEAVHTIQANLTPEQLKGIPPDTGNPLVAIDPEYLKKQRAAGKTLLQLPKEQWSYLSQFYESKKEAFEKGLINKKEMDHVEDTYGPWIKDFNKVKLSTILPTNADDKGIVTTPRAPLQPIDMQQSTVQFNPTSTVPSTSSTGNSDRTRFEQQTADMGQLIKQSDPEYQKKLAKPVDWMKKGHSYAGDAGAEKPANFRPSKQHQEFKNNDEDSKPSTDDSTQAKDLRQQLLKNRIADVENPLHKNPFAFTHPLDRQAATFAKAQRIIKNQGFAALPSDKKDHILGNYYDKYVVPVYQNSKIEPPNKEVWVGQIQKGVFKTSDFYEYSEATNKDAFSDLQASVAHAQASAVQTAGHVGHAILMAGVKTDRKILGLANFFPGSALHSWATEQADFDARIAEPALKLSQDVIDRPTFWLDTHPSRTYTEKASSFVGESLVQLPLYETISAPLGLFGKAVSSAGSVGKAANFTRRLATSKAGQFAGRRLAEASSAYVGDIFSETPEGERSTDMALFMGLGIGGEALKTLVKPISRTVMKKVVATNVAIGGKVLHETIADQAAFELEHNIVGTDAAGNPIHHDVNVHGPEDFSQQMKVAQDADPIKHSMITAEKMSQNAMSRQMYGKPLNQLSQLQRRNVRVELAHMTAEATVEIPIHVPEVAHHEVESQLKEDVQVNPELAETFAGLEKKYGAKIVDSVVETEKDSIAIENGIKSSQGATRKLGRNQEILDTKNTELGAGGKAKSNTPKSKEDQVFNELSDSGNVKYNRKDESFDLKFASKVDKALYRVSSTPQRFGGPETKARLASHDNSMRKLKQFFPEKSDSEIKSMASTIKTQIDSMIALRRADPTYKAGTHPEPGGIFVQNLYQKGLDVVHEDLPKSYVSFKSQSIAHFTNPFTSAAAKSKQTLSRFLDGMDDADFIQEISDQMGNQIKFEKPVDMLLWGLHHGDGIPAPITSKIKKVLHDQDPNGTIASWKDEGRRLSAHIDMLAMSGRLDTEGNVFRSTITTSFTGRTKWQKEAEKEAALEELENFKNSMAPYAKNFKEEYNAGLKELAKLQSLRRASKTDENFFAAHDKVKKILEKAEGGK